MHRPVQTAVVLGIWAARSMCGSKCILVQTHQEKGTERFEATHQQTLRCTRGGGDMHRLRQQRRVSLRSRWEKRAREREPIQSLYVPLPLKIPKGDDIGYSGNRVEPKLVLIIGRVEYGQPIERHGKYYVEIVSKKSPRPKNDRTTEATFSSLSSPCIPCLAKAGSDRRRASQK